MKNNRKKSVKTVFILGIFIFIILIIISYLVTSIHFHNTLKECVGGHQKIIGLLVVDTLEEMIGQQKHIYYERFSEKHPSRSLFATNDVQNAYTLSREGKVSRVFKRSKGFYIYPGINISHTSFFQTIRNMKKGYEILPIMYSPFSNRLIRPFVMKREKDYLIVDINLMKLSKLFSQIRSYKGSIIAVSRFGNIIISKTDTQKFPFVISEEGRIMGGKERFILTPVHSSVLDEKIYILTPYSLLYSKLSSVIKFSTFLFAIIVVILIFMIIWFIQQVILPISSLSKAVSKFSLEQPLTLAMLPPTKYEELDKLKETFLNASKRMSEDAKKIRETSIYLKNLTEYFPNGIIIVNPRTMKIEEVNQTTEKLCSKSRKEMVGHSLYEVFPMLKRYITKENKGGERLKIKKNGRTLEIKINKIKEEDFFRIIVQIDDITEKEILEEKLNQVKRMETVNLLSKGFSHDFNNLLNAISGYAEILSLSPDEEKRKNASKKLRETLDLAEELVRKIQILSKTTKGDREIISVKEFLISPISTIRAGAKNIHFEIDIEGILDEKIYGDSYLLSISILNILENAKEAVKEKDEPIIKIYGKKVTREGREYISLTIEDNGKGMDEEAKNRIFEPFFTTKGLGKRRGTGLGMTIVYGVIDAHEGMIDVDTEIGKGTKITILLPIINHSPR